VRSLEVVAGERARATRHRYAGIPLAQELSVYAAAEPGPVSPRRARELRPPRPPRDARRLLDDRLTVLVHLGFPALLLFLAGHALRATVLTDAAVALGAVAVLYAGWLVAAARSGRFGRQASVDAERYRRARQRWEGLFFCIECREVFSAQRSECIPPGRVQGYLHAPTADEERRTPR
jgi:hypothetical protein